MPIRRDARHETAGEGRHRDLIFQQLSAEILREAHDQQTLDIVTHRVLNHPDVRRDTQLGSMLRTCIGQASGELRARIARHRDEEAGAGRQPELHHAPPAALDGASLREVAVSSFERLRRLYDERLLHFDLDAGKRLLAQIEEFQTHHPTAISPAMVERCRMDLVRTEQRCAEFTAEIESLAQTAVACAQSGLLDEAGKALKRLSSIRAARPRLLSEERLEGIRKTIETGGDHFEHREAGRALVARERAVGEELGKLADIVHEFHRVSHEIPHGDPAYAEAERRYLTAVREVRHHDQEWLADLMVEMDELQSDLHDRSGKAEAQVTRFLLSVKTSIAQIVKEIREIRAEQAAEAVLPPGNRP